MRSANPGLKSRHEPCEAHPGRDAGLASACRDSDWLGDHGGAHGRWERSDRAAREYGFHGGRSGGVDCTTRAGERCTLQSRRHARAGSATAVGLQRGKSLYPRASTWLLPRCRACSRDVRATVAADLHTCQNGPGTMAGGVRCDCGPGARHSRGSQAPRCGVDGGGVGWSGVLVYLIDLLCQSCYHSGTFPQRYIRRCAPLRRAAVCAGGGTRCADSPSDRAILVSDRRYLRSRPRDPN